MEGLPEGCISHILSLTSAQDVCRSSTVSLDFQSAAGSDSVWEKFLPSDYNEIISDSVTPVLFSTKKELYASLCRSPILLRGGTKSFQLEKKSGKKCYMIGARELCICWGDTPEYWNWASLPESRLPEVAQLKVVCWLDIKGVMRTEMLSPNTAYVAYFVFMVGDNFNGFENLPIEVSVRFVDGAADEGSLTTTCLHVPRHRRSWWSRSSIPQNGVQIEQARGDGWKEVKLGEFFNDGHGEVEMRLSEIRVLNWKTGLIVQVLSFGRNNTNKVTFS